MCSFDVIDRRGRPYKDAPEDLEDIINKSLEAWLGGGRCVDNATLAEVLCYGIDKNFALRYSCLFLSEYVLVQITDESGATCAYRYSFNFTLDEVAEMWRREFPWFVEDRENWVRKEVEKYWHRRNSDQ